LWINHAVAGATHATTAAFGDHALDQIIHCALHHADAFGNFNAVFCAVKFDVIYYWH
jgi:hypothetical protein